MTVTKVIDAPREAVFAILTDVARWPAIIRGIAHVELPTPGPIGVGTRFRETRVMFGRAASEEMTVAELTAPSLLVLTAENHGTRYRAAHVLEDAGAGTQMTMTFEGTPVTLAARLLMPLGYLMAGHVRRQLEADLEDIKHAAEARGQREPRPQRRPGQTSGKY